MPGFSLSNQRNFIGHLKDFQEGWIFSINLNLYIYNFHKSFDPRWLVLTPIQIIHAIHPSSHFATPLLNEYLSLHPKRVAMFKAMNKMIKTFIIAKKTDVVLSNQSWPTIFHDLHK